MGDFRLQEKKWQRAKTSISYQVIKFVDYLAFYQHARLVCSQQVPGCEIHGTNDKGTLVLCWELDTAYIYAYCEAGEFLPGCTSHLLLDRAGPSWNGLAHPGAGDLAPAPVILSRVRNWLKFSASDQH